MYEDITVQARTVVTELLDQANMKPGTLFVVGCSSSEMVGKRIGMHLRRVAVPVRTSLHHIGEAIVLCARTRPKYIGGPRAVYQD